MSMKTTKAMMKVIGGTLAVCSAVAMAGGMMSSKGDTKKMMKKTFNKMSDIVDAMASFM